MKHFTEGLAHVRVNAGAWLCSFLPQLPRGEVFIDHVTAVTKHHDVVVSVGNAETVHEIAADRVGLYVHKRSRDHGPRARPGVVMKLGWVVKQVAHHQKVSEANDPDGSRLLTNDPEPEHGDGIDSL